MGIPDDDPSTSADGPSHSELVEEVLSLRRLVAEVVETNEKLRSEVTELRARLSLNSRNSSKPPSSDGYEKPAPKSRRVRSGKKPGKQPGDPGKHLAKRTDPDAVATHAPKSCSGCGGDLSDAPVTSVATRQVFDLPPVALLCTEHRSETKRCSCGASTAGAFPAVATAPACYGPALRAQVCYLVTRQHLPIARVAELLADTYGAPVSTGTIVAMVKEGAGMLQGFLAQVKDLLSVSKVIHGDETGLRVKALLAWVHAVSSTELTLYHLDDKRGNGAMDAMGILPTFQGIVVHDGWKAYAKYEKATHALCNAHHLRELTAIAEQEGQHWAEDMADLLTDTWAQVLVAKEKGRAALTKKQLQAFDDRYFEIIDAGHLANPPPISTRRRPKQSKARNLLIRLDRRPEDVQRFAWDFSVPFDNNLSERDIRMIKITQKISGGFRTTEGAEAFLAFRSYLSTVGKQGVNRLGALQQLFLGDPWMPSVPTPG